MASCCFQHGVSYPEWVMRREAGNSIYGSISRFIGMRNGFAIFFCFSSSSYHTLDCFFRLYWDANRGWSKWGEYRCWSHSGLMGLLFETTVLFDSRQYRIICNCSKDIRSYCSRNKKLDIFFFTCYISYKTNLNLRTWFIIHWTNPSVMCCFVRNSQFSPHL